MSLISEYVYNIKKRLNKINESEIFNLLISYVLYMNNFIRLEQSIYNFITNRLLQKGSRIKAWQ